MNLNNFRIPAAVIGLSLISGVAMLSFDSSTNAQGVRQTEAIKYQMNHPKRFECYREPTCSGEVLSNEEPHACHKRGGKSCTDHFVHGKCAMWYRMRVEKVIPEGENFSTVHWELDPNGITYR